MRVGLISDTHGLLRPQALALLAGVERIIHAGDIGKPEVLDALREIAPVVAIRGNNDRGEWARELPHDAVLEAEGARVYVLHDLAELDVDPAAAGFRVVVAGHSHRPAVLAKEGVLFVNPGSAGPRRFRLPVSIGFLDLGGKEPQARIELLEV